MSKLLLCGIGDGRTELLRLAIERAQREGLDVKVIDSLTVRDEVIHIQEFKFHDVGIPKLRIEKRNKNPLLSPRNHARKK
jgi:hypothetical protein